MSDTSGKHSRGQWAAGLVLTLSAVIVGSSCQESSPAPETAHPTMLSTAAPSGNAATTKPASAQNPAVLAEVGFFSYPAAPNDTNPARRELGSRSCMACHNAHDSYSMHANEINISCVDCHGGDSLSPIPANIANLDPKSAEYIRVRDLAHPKAKVPGLWTTSSNPVSSGAESLKESPDYIRFVNPGDLRAAMVSCGECHASEVQKVRTSMMAHGAMLWGAALYNNGAIDRKNPIFGEFYTVDGKPAGVIQDPLPTRTEADRHGILTSLWPLPRWEITQPGNILRVFEQGGKIRPAVGIPDTKEDPGRPDVKLSLRGLGTDVRTDPVFIGLQKTRLLDPTLNLVGSNDHPGDFRASGCSACHVVYANDRSPVHSTLMWARYGNRGESFSVDPTVNPGSSAATRPTTGPTTPYENAWDETRPARAAGRPIKHVMVRNMPTSTCITCHIHPGTNVVNSYLGFMWWDNETDGRFMYPGRQMNPSEEMRAKVAVANPEGTAARGLWSNQYPNEKDHTGQVAGPNFLEKLGTPEFNAKLTRTQFADFHGHGWIYRAVFKQDRHGNLLDHRGQIVPPHKPEEGDRFNKAMAAGVAFQSPKNGAHPPDGVPVHLKDIHLERGMHCVDCHFEGDAHGNGNLYGETRNATHINCEDCHGTMTEPAKIMAYLEIREGIREGSAAVRDKLLAEALSGNAAAAGDIPTRMTNARRLVDGKSKRFEIRAEDGRFVQISALDPNIKWPVPQTIDTVNPDSWWSKASAEAAAARRQAEPPAAAPPPAAPATPASTPTTAKTPISDVDRATLARYAHTIRKDGVTWGTLPTADDIHAGKDLAHRAATMSCYSCHTSWNTSCFGCHLPMEANQRTKMQHNEGTVTRNYTRYNYQTLRDDVFMLGVDSTTKDHKIVPIRSACAVMVTSTDANRQVIYGQQQTVSAEGFAGTAFSPYFPHTVRATETKQCSDCHVSKKNDNNAIMAQLLLQGTNSVNFVGRFAYVGLGKGGVEAIAVTERQEPQAVFGSTLHQLAYPDDYKKHVAGGGKLTEAYDHHGVALDVQLRGEYLYVAAGRDGFIAYDVATIDNKGFSERIVTAPVSPLGQRLYVKTKYATSVCSPSTLAVDPTRPRLSLIQKLTDGTVRAIMPNEEGKITEIGNPSKVIDPSRPIHLLYAFIYVTDAEEGLVVVGNPLDSKNRPGVATLLDGNPMNNFLERATTFNPDGLLKGARHMALHGTLAYVACDAGVVVVDLDNPLQPKHVATIADGIRMPKRIALQFRYAFVCDADGLKVIDVTDPRKPALVVRDGSPAIVPLADARDVYISRTYGYVAAGRDGLVIVDLERPEYPRRLQYPADIALDYNSAAKLDDATAVRVGMTNASMFAYVADGRNGLKVLQLTSPEYNPTFGGFSPRPEPRLVAHHKTHAPAIALSEGLDRDRAVDESGNQLAVFGRRGARPFTLAEMQRLYLRGEGDKRQVYTVSDVPETAPVQPAGSAVATPAPPPEPPKPKPKLPFGPKK